MFLEQTEQRTNISACFRAKGNLLLVYVVVYVCLWFMQLFRERLWEKKISRCTRQDRKVVWVFTGIVHIGLKEIYKFVFLHVENLFFSSQGPISVALLLLSHVFERGKFF